MTRDRFEVVGQLTVTDEHGETRTVEIRREDLTTTNAGYRAVRDACVEVLRDTLRANRRPLVRECDVCPELATDQTSDGMALCERHIGDELARRASFVG